MLSSGMKRYHLVPMLSSGTTCYHLGWYFIIWDAMFSTGANVIIWDKMLSSGANVIMVSSGANVIIWCYHVMLSSGMITRPFFIFPENFTHSRKLQFFVIFWRVLCSTSLYISPGFVRPKPCNVKRVKLTFSGVYFILTIFCFSVSTRFEWETSLLTMSTLSNYRR